MIKPSELTPHFSALLKEVIAQKFDATELLVTGIEDEIAKAFASAAVRSSDLHRLDPGRAARRGGRGTQSHAGDARARRQVAGDRRPHPPISTRPPSASPTPSCSMPGRPASRRITRWCRRTRVQAFAEKVRTQMRADVRHRARQQGLHLDHLRPALCAAGGAGGGRRRQGREDPAAGQGRTIRTGRHSANSRRRWWSAPRPRWA